MKTSNIIEHLNEYKTSENGNLDKLHRIINVAPSDFYSIRNDLIDSHVKDICNRKKKKLKTYNSMIESGKVMVALTIHDDEIEIQTYITEHN